MGPERHKKRVRKKFISGNIYRHTGVCWIYMNKLICFEILSLYRHSFVDELQQKSVPLLQKNGEKQTWKLSLLFTMRVSIRCNRRDNARNVLKRSSVLPEENFEKKGDYGKIVKIENLKLKVKHFFTSTRTKILECKEIPGQWAEVARHVRFTKTIKYKVPGHSGLVQEKVGLPRYILNIS